MNKTLTRCAWVGADDELMQKYHDEEWGVPLYDDNAIFEFLCLEAFQAGLSWKTILYKRENFRKAFANFNPVKVSKFGDKDIARLMQDAGIVRNSLKIHATINNASKFLAVQKEFGTFSNYMWGFVGGKPIIHTIKTLADYKPVEAEAITWAKDLKRRGFKFLGPTTLYAHMQATGMVNDHMEHCFKKL